MVARAAASAACSCASRGRRRSTATSGSRSARRPSARRFADAFAEALRACGERRVTRRAVRYAIVSDVHGNLEALEAAFAALRDDDALLCLGDIVGYGPQPNECVERIRARATATVLGNHDVAAIDDFGLAYFNPAAKRGDASGPRACSAPRTRAWLDGLGYEFRMPDFLLVHGAPVNYFEYILDKAARRAGLRGDRRAADLHRPHPHRRGLRAARPTARSSTATCSRAARSRSRTGCAT